MSHFNSVANDWDSEDKIKQIKIHANAIKKNLGEIKDQRILDFGAGTGLLGFEFIDNAKSLLGIDTSQGMLDVMALKAKDISKVSTLNINLENESLDNEFDLIISSMAFHHLNKPGIVLQKLANALTKNGKIVIIDLDEEDGTFHPDNKKMGVKHFGFNQSQIKSWIKDENLNVEISIINKIEKNQKTYGQFMAIFSHK